MRLNEGMLFIRHVPSSVFNCSKSASVIHSSTCAWVGGREPFGSPYLMATYSMTLVSVMLAGSKFWYFTPVAFSNSLRAGTGR